MNKADLADIVAKDVRTSKRIVENVINITMATIIQEVANGGRVTLTGFGSFEQRKYIARTVCDLRTQERLYIPAKTVAAFKAGKEFTTAVNQKP